MENSDNVPKGYPGGGSRRHKRGNSDIVPKEVPKEPLINLRIMAHCGFDSRATVWTGS